MHAPGNRCLPSQRGLNPLDLAFQVAVWAPKCGWCNQTLISGQSTRTVFSVAKTSFLTLKYFFLNYSIYLFVSLFFVLYILFTWSAAFPFGTDTLKSQVILQTGMRTYTGTCAHTDTQTHKQAYTHILTRSYLRNVTSLVLEEQLVLQLEEMNLDGDNSKACSKSGHLQF